MPLHHDSHSIESIQEANQKLLDSFIHSLGRLSTDTKKVHLGNLDLFLNEYLLDNHPVPAEQAISLAVPFMDYFLVSTPGATPALVRSMASSLRKFYQFLAETGRIDPADYENLHQTIRNSLPRWLQTSEGHLHSTDSRFCSLPTSQDDRADDEADGRLFFSLFWR